MGENDKLDEILELLPQEINDTPTKRNRIISLNATSIAMATKISLSELNTDLIISPPLL